MQTGVLIEQGPVNWQIIQQVHGFADIHLSGIYVRKPRIEDEWGCQVYARLVCEDTGAPVIHWQKAELLPENRWSTVLCQVPAGGLYRIETCLAHQGNNWSLEWGVRGDMVHHVGIGDLYLIAGQSNSKGYGREPVNDPPELGVHLFRQNGSWDLATHPLGDSTGILHETARDGTNTGHSPYLNFAKILKHRLGYPIGLVQTSKGGSPLREWNPDETGTLYHAMLDFAERTGGKLKGVLWYQGCSDTGEGTCDTYYERFENIVRHLRTAMKDERLPFLTSQLNRSAGKGDVQQDKHWGKLREAQRQAALHIPGIYIVPTLDLGLSDGIHNNSAGNMALGERLAKVALHELYGFHIQCHAPNILSAVQVEPNELHLKFDHIYYRLDTRGIDENKLPFTVTCGEETYSIMNYRVCNKDTMVLTLDRPLEGDCFVHGAFEKNPEVFVPFDVGTHLPMLSFYEVKVEKP